MRRVPALLLLLSVLFLLPSAARAQVRALLVACREFLSAPSLGYDSSANLQTLAACLTLSGVEGSHIRLEDGTIASADGLMAAARQAFSEAAETDVCLLYLCTHGLQEPCLLLSDGARESRLTPGELYGMLRPLPGKKLIILDACSSGAFLADFPPLSPSGEKNSHLSVLTSCRETERSWYSAGERLSSGTLSYFAEALCAGLGLHGDAEADTDADGQIGLAELYKHLQNACVLSTPQLSPGADTSISLPAVRLPLTGRALSDFSFGSSLLSPGAPEISLSCTVRRPAGVEYRVIEYQRGEWDWPNAIQIRGGQVQAGRLSQTIRLMGAEPGAYYALQVYALEDGYASLCASRLFAIAAESPAEALPQREFFLSGADAVRGEARLFLPCPALLTCLRVSPEGETLSVLCRSHLFLPDREGDVALPADLAQPETAESIPLFRVLLDPGSGTEAFPRAEKPVSF